ncbi:glycerophosphoryl diester phosphodiesterase [Leuconostoc litchii]|uniref:Glycerophosphodiester phosphodiesterase n=1 Tax=Leuconostoc litchii TaxID=1981069 RepID=A0A6P2CLB4_9LACO|nr:glycerophosphodiester phosphodiesterase family protein [Leuconostoc litchii]TYC46770.1 glycerophosphodiester phosphodiesterase [Leuconostoc litchii]GMA70656.1 glycerophosphoryl diester phosphodiesterase [Leuconostoc litchii]
MATTIFGHRGIPVKFVENSISGFEYLAQHGEAVEFDVHLTKDNVPVVMHDEKLDRTTDYSGFIKDLNFSDLQTVKLINDKNRKDQNLVHDEYVPTLDDVLAIFNHSNIQLNIELKTDQFEYPGIEESVLNALKAYDLQQPIIFSSFNIQTLKRLYQIDHTQNLAFLSPFKIQNPVQFMANNHFQALHLNYESLLESNIVQRIWTVNDEEQMKSLFLRKIAGIFTDDFETAIQLRDTIG